MLSEIRFRCYRLIPSYLCVFDSCPYGFGENDKDISAGTVYTDVRTKFPYEYINVWHNRQIIRILLHIISKGELTWQIPRTDRSKINPRLKSQTIPPPSYSQPTTTRKRPVLTARRSGLFLWIRCGRRVMKIISDW